MTHPFRRAQQAEVARRLRTEGEGLSIPAIAREMGISVSYAGELLVDPTGDRARERKAKYKPPAKRPRNRRKWTKPMVIEALQEWDKLHGRPPFSYEWSNSNNLPDWVPSAGTVYNLFGRGGWNKAMAEAGFPPRKAVPPEWTRGEGRPVTPMTPEVREAMSEERKALYATNPDHPMFQGLKTGHQLSRQRREARQRRQR
jgi:hypothetical protein